MHVLLLIDNERLLFLKVDREDISLQVQDVCELTDCGRVDYIIHAASQASAWHFEHDPVGTINANLIGTQKVLELAGI